MKLWLRAAARFIGFALTPARLALNALGVAVGLSALALVFVFASSAAGIAGAVGLLVALLMVAGVRLQRQKDEREEVSFTCTAAPEQLASTHKRIESSWGQDWEIDAYMWVCVTNHGKTAR